MNAREVVMWVIIGLAVVALALAASGHGNSPGILQRIFDAVLVAPKNHDCDCDKDTHKPHGGTGDKKPAGALPSSFGAKYEDLTLRMMPDNQPPNRATGPNGEPVLNFAHGW